MIEFTFKAENETIKDAFVNFINNYKVNAADYMNQLVANDGSPCDSEIKIENGVLTVYHIAPDKGFVLGETGDEALPIQMMQYKNLESEKRYILPERDKLVLFYKNPEGEADLRLGAFKSLADVVLGFDSQPVKIELERVAEMKKAKKREDDRTKTRLERLQKQGAGEIEAIPMTEEPASVEEKSE